MLAGDSSRDTACSSRLQRSFGNFMASLPGLYFQMFPKSLSRRAWAPLQGLIVPSVPGLVDRLPCLGSIVEKSSQYIICGCSIDFKGPRGIASLLRAHSQLLTTHPPPRPTRSQSFQACWCFQCLRPVLWTVDELFMQGFEAFGGFGRLGS